MPKPYGLVVRPGKSGKSRMLCLAINAAALGNLIAWSNHMLRLPLRLYF